MATRFTPDLQRHILLTYALLLCFSGLALAMPYNSEVNSQLQVHHATPIIQSNVRQLLSDPDHHYSTSPLKNVTHVQRLYRRFEYQLLWFEGDELTPAGEALIQTIKEHVLDQPSHYPYHAHQLLLRLQTMQSAVKEISYLDVLLTDAFFSYARDAMTGHLLPNQNEPDHPAMLKTRVSGDSDNLNLPTTASTPNDPLIESFTTGTFQRDQLLPLINQVLTPKHNGYLQLRDALEHYLRLAQNMHHWSSFEDGPDLAQGDQHPQIEQLRHRLSLLGDLNTQGTPETPHQTPPASFPRDYNTPLNFPGNPQRDSQRTLDASDRLDPLLLEALKQFQRRHGLPATGVLNNATRAQLNVLPSQRIQQIAINMKRWRYLPDTLGERYIMANIADYTLQAVEQSQTSLQMDIIVGRASRRTPIMVQSIRTLVLNPTWAIPPRIARTTILPNAKKNPGSLRRQNIEIVIGTGSQRKVIDPKTLDWETININKFPYRLEQKPGRRNTLGEVKYPLNNDYAIYLHDTAQPKLFKRSMRALSSGCVRVSKPRELTAWLLKDNPGWTKRRIARAHRNKRTLYLGLKEDVPVYLMYWTAWVDEDGLIHFRKDIYGRDRQNSQLASVDM